MRIKKTNRERGVHMGHTGRNSMSSVVWRQHGGIGLERGSICRLQGKCSFLHGLLQSPQAALKVQEIQFYTGQAPAFPDPLPSYDSRRGKLLLGSLQGESRSKCSDWLSHYLLTCFLSGLRSPALPFDLVSLLFHYAVSSLSQHWHPRCHFVSLSQVKVVIHACLRGIISSYGQTHFSKQAENLIHIFFKHLLA